MSSWSPMSLLERQLGRFGWLAMIVSMTKIYETIITISIITITTITITITITTKPTTTTATPTAAI